MDATNKTSWDEFLKSCSEANADFASYQKRVDEDRKNELLQEEQNLTDDINRLEDYLNAIEEKGCSLLGERESIKKRLADIEAALESHKKSYLMNEKKLEELKTKREAVHREWCENFSTSKPMSTDMLGPESCGPSRIAYVLWDRLGSSYPNRFGLIEPYKSIYKRVYNLVSGQAKSSDLFNDGVHAWTINCLIDTFYNIGYRDLARAMEEKFEQK